MGEDDVAKFKSLFDSNGIQFLLNQRFEHGMNVLNYAIDQESTNIVQFMAVHFKQEQVRQLVEYRYAKEMQAIHQAISLGELKLITILTE